MSIDGPSEEFSFKMFELVTQLFWCAVSIRNKGSIKDDAKATKDFNAMLEELRERSGAILDREQDETNQFATWETVRLILSAAVEIVGKYNSEVS